ncbi:MAG: hypothetical protein ABI165_08540 [Bryobacteraceae bacterium]
MNSRMVQGLFDDANPETRSRWNYPDTGRWDAERNTREFVAAMPEWRRHGLLAFTVNLQCGSPEGYSKNQPWETGGFRADGSIKAAYLRRLQQILDRADSLGMAVIVGCFYVGQDQHLRDEAAVRRAVGATVHWVLGRGYRNVLLEIANECDVTRFHHPILHPPRIHELIAFAQSIRIGGSRLLAGASFAGGHIPTPGVTAASDFLLLHGNGVSDPLVLASMVDRARAVPGYRPMPILFNEDDHFDFEKPVNNMLAAIGRGASWGFFDPGKSNYIDGYQCPPVNWSINTDRKKAFFKLLAEVTGS